MVNPDDRYQTIHTVSKLPNFPKERTLRRMVKDGKVPGYHAGQRFYIDLVKFREQMDRLCDANVTAHE